MAKAVNWTITDAEARKRGEQTGLDTLVAVSYTHLALGGFPLFLLGGGLGCIQLCADGLADVGQDRKSVV